MKSSPRPIEFLRASLGLILLLQAFAILPSLDLLHGRNGLVQWAITDAITHWAMPRLEWLSWIFGESASIRIAFVAYVLCLVGMLTGVACRPAVVGAWVLHLAFKTSGATAAYGVDEFVNVALFYLMFMPVGCNHLLDAIRGRRVGEASEAASLSIRVLQVQMCVVYLSAGLEKAMGAQWWNGEAIWRALLQPEWAQFDWTWMARAPWLAKVLCWGTLLIEAGYAVFVWPRRTRKLWVAATVGLHIGIGLAMCLVSFSAVMIALTLAAFGLSAEPPKLFSNEEECYDGTHDRRMQNV